MISEHRKQQLREAQRRRREKLAAGERVQVNFFLTAESKEIVENFSLKYGVDKHDFINSLIKAFSNSPGILNLEI